MAAALDQVYPGPLAPLPQPIPFRPIPIVKGARKHRNKWALIIGIILDTNVDESDIGSISAGQKATFTVDAPEADAAGRGSN